MGLNKHQKAAQRPGERRVGHEDIERLLDMSRSSDPEERALAANYLCPCSDYRERGKCDFCGRPNVLVKHDIETEIPDGGSRRLALICQECYDRVKV